MPETPENTPVPHRSEDAESIYANNIHFEASVWDLKLVLGELDQSKNPATVEQHTILTIPWQQVRLTAYYLILNAMVYEITNGRIPLPKQIIPPRPEPTDPNLDETGKKLITYLAWVHDQFFGPNPYVPPGVGDLLGQQPQSA